MSANAHANGVIMSRQSYKNYCKNSPKINENPEILACLYMEEVGAALALFLAVTIAFCI